MNLEALQALIEETESITEKGVPKPPGEGWQMVFGRWVQTGKKTKAKEEPEAKPKGRVARVKDKLKQAKAKLTKDNIKGMAASLKQKLKGLPKEARRLVTDKEHRKEVGKKAAAALRRKVKSAADTIKHEAAEFKTAGKAMGKIAKGKKLDDHDKKAIKAVIKTIGLTVGGTLAMGGIGHFTAQALATHFAAETAIKSVGKAALFAHLLYEDGGDEEAAEAWVKKTIMAIADEVEKLGDMSDEEILEILSKTSSPDPA
jgi:hypothetical protein